MKLNLGLIFGGRSGEHEVSLQSANSIAAAIDKEKFYLLLLAVDKTGNWFLVEDGNYLENENNPATIKLKLKAEWQVALVPADGGNSIIRLSDGKKVGSLDVAFPIIHGTFGEDGSLQGFMGMLNIPCIGADIIGSSVGMDKWVAKKLLLQEGVPVADYLIAEKYTNIDKLMVEVKKKFTYPVFVKPAVSGSSVGVSKVENDSELKIAIDKGLLYDAVVLIEEAIAGREIECAILGNSDLFASVPGEIIPKHSFYSYEAKYIDADGALLELPAKIAPEVAEKVKEMAKRSYKALSCKGMARVDMFLCADGRLVLNEINTLPGFTKISMYPKLMDLSGIAYTQLINRLVELAIELHTQREFHLANVLKAGSY